MDIQDLPNQQVIHVMDSSSTLQTLVEKISMKMCPALVRDWSISHAYRADPG